MNDVLVWVKDVLDGQADVSDGVNYVFEGAEDVLEGQADVSDGMNYVLEGAEDGNTPHRCRSPPATLITNNQ